MKTEAAERLRQLMPLMAEQATALQSDCPDGMLRVAIIVASPDGTQRVGCTFRYEPFVADLQALLNHEEEVPP